MRLKTEAHLYWSHQDSASRASTCTCNYYEPASITDLSISEWGWRRIRLSVSPERFIRPVCQSTCGSMPYIHRGVRGSSPADGLRGSPVHPRSSRRVHESCCATRLPRTVGQRSPGVLGALARRARRARGGDGAHGGDDAGHDGRARSGARPGAARQDAGRDRSSFGGSAPRGRRSGLFA